jgi:hypothetical protein
MHAFHIADADDDPMKARDWAALPKRRWLVFSVMVLMALMAVSLGVVLDGIAGVLTRGEALTTQVTVLSPLLFVCVFLAMRLDRNLFLASRPAFSLPDEPHDERQQALVNMATRRGLKLALIVLVLVTAVGVSPLSAAYVLAAGLVGVALVIAGPQMILAWALRPSDFDFEGLEDEDG